MAVSGYDEYTLYLARNRGVAKELFWPKIRGLVKAHNLPWHINESELRITTPAGGSLLVKGAEGGDPEEEREKLRGLKLRRVLCDEPATYAATLRKLLRDVIEPGLGDLRGDCIVNGTPGIVCSGAWHEISTGVLPPGDRRPKSSLEKWARWHWDLRANPFFHESERYLQEVMAENGWTEEDPTFQREYLGRWVVDVSAQVYRYVAARNTVTEVPNYDKHTWVHSIGVDFGMVDECAWTVLASPPHGRDIYAIRSEARVGLRPEQAAQFTHDLVTEYRPHRLVGDAGGLGKPYVEEYNHRFDAGLRMVPAEKTEKRAHIELINGDFGAPRLFLLMPQCEDLAGQLENLPWADDSREHPHAGYKDHRSDSLLYSWRDHTAYMHGPAEERTDKLPGEPGYEAYLEQIEVERFNKSRNGWMHR